MQTHSKAAAEKQGIQVAALIIFISTLVLLALTLSPGPDTRLVVLLFKPATSPAHSLQATLALGGSPVSTGGGGHLVFARFDEIPGMGRLWEHGALMALNPLFKSGCAGSPSRQMTERKQSPTAPMVRTGRSDTETSL